MAATLLGTTETTLGLLGMRERANALGGSVIIEGSPAAVRARS